jgi:hypothetical protein
MVSVLLPIKKQAKPYLGALQACPELVEGG